MANRSNLKNTLLLSSLISVLALSTPAYANVSSDDGFLAARNAIWSDCNKGHTPTPSPSPRPSPSPTPSPSPVPSYRTVTNTNMNTNLNTNLNTNSQSQAQHQTQSQSQSQSAYGGAGGAGGAGGSVSGSGNSTNNVNNSANNSSNNSSSNTSNSTGNNTNVSYTNNVPKAPVNSAYAPMLTAADDTCMGSSTAGAQGMTFGVSLGSTWHDGDCVRRKDARELHNMGHNVAAIALMCQNDAVRKAFEDAGEHCPDGTVQEQPQQVEEVPNMMPVPLVPVTQAPTTQVIYTDGAGS